MLSALGGSKKIIIKMKNLICFLFLGKDSSMTNGMGNKEIEPSEELAKCRIVEEAKEKDKEEDRRKQSTATTESKWVKG